MRAIVFAYNEIGHRGLSALLAQGFEVAAVFTHTDDPNENRWFPSVAELAAEHGIPVFAPDDVAHPLWIERIRAMEPDMLFSFYYRKLLAPEVLELAPKGAFNLHGSALPRYRGRCPLNWVLVHGERETGVTLHHMTARADAGDIVDQLVVPIAATDDAPTLAVKLGEAATALLERALPALLDGSATRTPQDESLATKFGGRRPEDGEIHWAKRATEVRDLVRAVAAPWPGAFTHVSGRKVVVWKTRALAEEHDLEPGTVVREDPLVIACGDGALEVVSGQPEGGVTQGGAHLGRELALVEGIRIGRRGTPVGSRARKKRVLILGSDGFIGSHLSDRLLSTGRYELSAIDLNCRNTSHLLNHPDYRFFEGDIGIHREWIEYHVKKADVVLPLVAIATPIEYVRNPLKVFELDFERNLEVVRYCVKYQKRLIFPSTSEVYGMCEDDEFDEERSNLVLGPIHRQRWIYSCIKQLLDRVIWAHGQKDGLRFTLFRPFNWIGPRLDSLDAARIGSSRAITQLVLNLVEGTPMLMIDGGAQMRCFTDVSDGIEGLFRIIDDDSGVTDGRIVNIGAPDNEASIKELAELLIRLFEEHPLRAHFPPTAGLREIESEAHYGKGYEDVRHRRPSIANARKLLDWEPREDIEGSVARTLDHFLRQTLDQDVNGVLWPAAPAEGDGSRPRSEQAGPARMPE